MDYQRAREQLKPYLTGYVESNLQKSKGQNMYNCPVCGSGTGKGKTGALSVAKNGTRWKCFSCGNGGDIFDLIGIVENIPEPLEQLKRAGELYGISIDDRNQTGRKAEDMSIHTSVYTHEDTHKEPEKKDSLLPYFKECQSHISETDYLKKRGISEEVAKRFMLGYDAHFTRGTGGKEWQALIIPTGEYSYTARNTDKEANDKDRYRKNGTGFLNIKRLYTADKPIFIVEGELDALSIIEVGGEAIGLGSTANINGFINNYLKNQKPAHALLLALDNEGRGQKAEDELASKLEELGISYYRVKPYSGHKDANEALMADREAFKEEVDRAEHIEEEALEAERDAYLQNSVQYQLNTFLDDIQSKENTRAQTTGFYKLNKSLDGGLYAGLYIIGAITSLGKTTLALQMADNIAKSGKDVLIFSLEMARSELMAKSISRHTFLKAMADGLGTQYAKTNRGITAWERWERYSDKERQIIGEALEAYYKYANHLYIHEGVGDIGTEQIREEIEKHKYYTGQTPVVLVDYLQIIAPHDARLNDKQNTDKAVLELKRTSRDYHTPVIGISSLNRAGYNEPITYESFKESGAIEYGSDVLIGLQLKGVGTYGFDVNEAKRKEPREIELVVLKNRNGRTGDMIAYRYYPMFNYFEEV